MMPVLYASRNRGFKVLGSLSNLSLKSRMRRSGNFATNDTYHIFVAVWEPSGRPGLSGTGIASVPVGADTLFFKNVRLCGAAAGADAHLR